MEELPSNAMESMCEEDRDRVGAIFREIAEGRRVSAITRYRVRCSDGRLREVELTARSAIDDPAVGGIIVNTRDITEKARAEALLRAQAQMQAAVAAVGQAALAGRDIAELAQAACDAVGANLDAKYVLVLEPGAHSLVLRAGFGLPEDAVLGSELDAGETFSSRAMRCARANPFSSPTWARSRYSQSPWLLASNQPAASWSYPLRAASGRSGPSR